MRANLFDDEVFVCHFDLAHTWMHAHHLDVVDLAVAAHQHHDQLVVGTHQHALDGVLWRITEEVADVFDRRDVWRLDLFDRRRVVLILAGHRLCFGDLDVAANRSCRNTRSSLSPFQPAP